MRPIVSPALTNLPAPGDTLIVKCHAREADGLDDAFALVISEDTFILAVQRGLLPKEDICLLDRIVRRGVAELLKGTALALTS